MKIIPDNHRHISDTRSYNPVRIYGECEEMIPLFRKIRSIIPAYDLGTVKTVYNVLVYTEEHGIDVNHISIHSDHILPPRVREYALENFPNIGTTFKL